MHRRAIAQAGMGFLLTGALPKFARGQVPELWEQPRVVRVALSRLGRAQPLSSLTYTPYEYWRDGQVQMDAYLALSRLCADHHAGAAVQMDPRLFDLMFATQRWYEQATDKIGVHLITSAYRTPSTNLQVGGSPASQHLVGRALDGRLLGVDLPTYARMLKAFGAGGVGLYQHHVHWDVGRAPHFWMGNYKE